MYYNIRLHMKKYRVRLFQKLWELNLPQKLEKKNLHMLFTSNRVCVRRHSAGSVDRMMVRMEESIESSAFERPAELPHTNTMLNNALKSWTQKYVLVPVEDSPESYAKLIKCICQYYEVLCTSSGQLEKLCSQKLKMCQAEPNIAGCNIHKSLFMSKILNNDLIKVQ